MQSGMKNWFNMSPQYFLKLRIYLLLVSVHDTEEPFCVVYQALMSHLVRHIILKILRHIILKFTDRLGALTDHALAGARRDARRRADQC
jgi:hypothetical protein